ncbi:PP2C family protein-serine/threonine phosphatase [Streptomyces caatingaensis]|uniref:Phosphatase n=1 Tax=Streptomyces caatingaensis TaxID=1678637 RepID=A0A0K9XI28_9ACTN|nr:SpoIIE family protein phosphatase [Streptomyces caatingaensis]KNB52317.1 phosphatase [Streptomyces caatingaensis]
MPSPSSASPAEFPADHAPGGPPAGVVDELISQTRRLRGGIDAVRRGTEGSHGPEDPLGRWQRTLCDLATHQLDDLGARLGQLRDGPPLPAAPDAAPEPAAGAGLTGSAEWNLLTDEVTWSEELFRLFGRSPRDGALTLDELPSCLVEEDRELLSALVTDCLVDGKPIDGEFRIVHPDGPRTVHMRGEPVLDDDGCTAAMWAVLRDVTTLHRGREAVAASGHSLHHHRHLARAERRLAAGLQEAVLPAWQGPLHLPRDAGAPGVLDVAGHYLPAADGAAVGGNWFDALPLPDGRTLLGAGGLSGRGVAAASTMAVLLGAVRGMALTGTEPGRLMGCLNQLLDTSAQPARGSAVCCRYDPRTRVLHWAQAGHPAPLLFRGGTARPLPRPDGVLLGAIPDARYEQAEDQLRPGDVLLLHTDACAGSNLLPGLADRFSEARSAQECVRSVLDAWNGERRQDDACVLVARVGG